MHILGHKLLFTCQLGSEHPQGVLWS